ncbi:AAA domain-containing protein [Aspergillus heterothallicus]
MTGSTSNRMKICHEYAHVRRNENKTRDSNNSTGHRTIWKRQAKELIEFGESTLQEELMLPFMEIITHPNALASLVMEQAVGTIYNCLYGIGGSKAATAYLEQSLLVFWKIVELNSTAFVQEPLKTSRDYLDKLQHRLDIGLSLPALSKTTKQHVNHQPVAFIKVMPTFQEILSPRPEYLPPKDPRQNFRLLREDTIGQLRDAIHAEIQPVDSRQRSPVRGFLVHFSQPTNEWWQLSKRLQPDALVCIVDPRGPKSDPTQKQQERLAVEPGESSWQYILDCLASQHNPSSISLPTLLALQKMQKAGDDQTTLSILADVPPPVYAAPQSFSFDLKCLMNDHSSLQLHSSRPFALQKLQDGSTLDDAQALALASTLQRTGKSFTGVALIKVLLANKAKVKRGLGPIVCLLEDLLDNGITSQIIRIGSQSKSERLQPLNLRNVVRGLHTALDNREDEFRKLKLNAIGSDHGLKSYLERHQPYHYAQLFAQDADGFQRKGKGKPAGTFQSWLKAGKHSRAQPNTIQELAKVHVDAMTAAERKALHAHWIDDYRQKTHLRAQAALHDHLETKASWDKIRDEIDLRCLKAADVIGMLQAGEVLEAHLLTSLLPSLEQVILIGDHQQLRPQIQNYDLSRESKAGAQYALDRSLFERLVEPDDEVGVQVPFCTLETQRRMHPSISQLIRNTLYPRLQDAPSVSTYPEVVGVCKRLFWLDHRVPEGHASREDAMATSHWNDHEIQLTTALVNHLLRQGTYQSGDIAVLTPYLGQLHRMRRRLSQAFTITVGERDQDDLDNAGFIEDEAEAASSNTTTIARSTLLHALRVATIDNFQGEEAKVVVISLVRSNNQNRCGFLRTPNRINVLLSRAKHGMYIIGNSATSRGVPMWGKVIDMLERDGNIGNSLDLTCPRHPDTPITVSEPEHFIEYSPEGGCSLQCNKRLQCGHPCKQKCHSDTLHAAVYCPEQCKRPQKGCTHPCPKPCGDPCPKRCTVNIPDPYRRLPCGHQMTNLPCWQAQDLSLVSCQTLVDREIPHCHHTTRLACYIDIHSADYSCRQQCRKVLPCGHDCKRQCLSCMDRTVEESKFEHGKCTQKCGRLYSTCAHACNAECHGDSPCQPCMSACDVQCGHSRCPYKCSEPCAPCAVSECLSSCPHSSCSMPCAAPCDHIPCSLRCEKTLSCGHRCPSVCGELCPSSDFCQACASDTIKETMVDFIMGEQYRVVDLAVNPCIFPPCGHFLTIESMDAQMDIKKHYALDTNGRPVSIASSSQPFSMDDIRTCAICRGSLRQVARYGRLVRRALLDEATKKFILYLNQDYVPMAQSLPVCISRLQEYESRGLAKQTARQVFCADIKIRLEGPPEHQVKLMRQHVVKYDRERWKELIALRDRINNYKSRVHVEEQPFVQVRNMVEDARRRKRSPGHFDFDANVLQTKGYLQAAALSLRLDASLLADFLSLCRKGRHAGLYVNLAGYRKEISHLVANAEASSRISQQVEGNIFLAQFCALERQNLADLSEADSLLQDGTAALDEAGRLCKLHPGQTRGFTEEIEGTRAMLRGSEFYAPVTNEERMAVLAAMAGEFRGTGHWYYCENGHPFTIGECGGAMELSRCPECGAAVGGQHHQTTAGVTRASDLENALREMHL